MYEKMKELVKEGKLVFDCGHHTNEKHYLEHYPELFFERIEYSGHALRDVYCFACGKYVDYELQGNKLIPTNKDCFDEQEVILEIPAPSGELLFDDWLENSTPVLAHLDKKSFDINCTKVQVDRAKDYAKIGVGHFFVGGSYPRICVKGNVFYIGRGKNKNKDEDGYEDFDVPVVEDGEILSTINTELRWTTIVDYAVFEAMAIETYGGKEGIKNAQEAKKQCDLAIKVAPGNYRITYYPNRKDDVELYAKIEKI